MRKRVKAMSAGSALRKAGNKSYVASKANYITGTKVGRMKSYDVTCHLRKRK